jgi:hypothetical protein
MVLHVLFLSFLNITHTLSRSLCLHFFTLFPETTFFFC